MGATLTDIAYPGTSIAVLLDGGERSERERRRIRDRYGERIDVHLLSVVEIEALYPRHAVRAWLRAHKAEPELARSFQPDDGAKASLSRIARMALGRRYHVVNDGEEIVRYMRPSDLDEATRIVLDLAFG